MLLAAVGAAGSALLTTDDESNKGTVSIVEPWTPVRTTDIIPVSRVQTLISRQLTSL